MRNRAILRRVMLASTALVPLGIVAAMANPLAPNVVGGTAAVTGVGTSNVTVNQSTPRAIINWNSFNIGAGETTRFVQPDASSIALNRVTGGLGPSMINGMLTANGRVFLVNPDGVMISKSGTINTAGFLATTHDISNANFMAGNYQFNISGRPSASIVNEGTINSHSQGFAALVAPGVRNSGTITASYGQIGLASGNSFSLDFYGDQLIKLAVNDSIQTTVRDVQTGQPLKSLVTNTGKLSANGGRVELTAAAARTIVDSVINNTGVIEARSVGTSNGKIVLGASTKVAGLPPQTVKVSGKLDVSNASGKGGKIQVTGEVIEVKAASFDASGTTGGGTVLIGGDTGGGYGHWAVSSIPQAALEPGAIPTAATVEIDAGTTINASATSVGNGGKVIVWADDSTTFAGTITARGGEWGGNGGFAEVSGKQTLAFSGFANTSAPYGSSGTLLLDPTNFTIGFVDGPNQISNKTLQNQLAVQDVILATNNATGTDPGDILVNSNVTWSSSRKLTLNAFHDIVFGINVDMSNTGAGHLVLRADSTGAGNGGTLILNNGTATERINGTATERINWLNSTGTVTVFYNPASYTTPTDFTVGNGRIGVASPGQLTSFMLVNTFANLQNIVDPGGNPALNRYALGTDIDANGGTLNPFTFTFQGIFEGKDAVTGQNHVISNVNVAGPAPLGFNSGTFRNFTLANWTVNATANNQFVGLLVGQNTSTGKIENVIVSGGTVNGGNFTGIVAGGMVGQNAGDIKSSTSSANVTVGNGLAGMGGGWNYAGGLVGINRGDIVSSAASGNVLAGSNAFAGGLAGQNGDGFGLGWIDLSSATGNVSSAGTNVTIGGLAGTNMAGGLITASFATGNVTASGNVTSPNCNPNCQMVTAGGLVGSNAGTIGDISSSSYAVYADGNVSVGSNAIGGGLVGQNHGVIYDARAGGNVTGSSGSATDHDRSFDFTTVLGGLVGINRGLIGFSRATGDVGNSSTHAADVGGFVGVNSGYIFSSEATGLVRAGNFSVAGGFVGAGEPDECVNCMTGDGSIFNNTNFIALSTASGNVSVGENSLGGGFAGAGSFIYLSEASGNVTGGSNSILGGFAGVHNIDGLIYLSNATGSVTGTGPSSWLGGFVGLNGGSIYESSASGPVTGVSGSILGGFAAMNLGDIYLSSSSGAVVATGGDNVAGGFGGANFGLITDSTSTGNTSSGANSVVGGFLGANATFVNIPSGLVAYSTFPVGTLVNSTGSGTATAGSGSTTGSQVGVSNPSKLPTYPTIFQGCDQDLCEVFRTGILLGVIASDGTIIPDEVLAPPTTQLLQFRTEPQPPNDALIKLTNLANLTTQQPGTTNRQTTGPSQVPGTPPASLAPPRPLRAVPGPDGEIRSNVPPLNETRFLANEVVLHVLANTSPGSVQQIAQQLGLTLITQQNLSSLGRTAYRLQIGGGRSVREIIRALEAINIIAVAQPNYQYQLVQQVPAAIAPFTASRGDPAQYTMGKLQLNEAHRVASGNNIIVAVIDSEVDRDHVELAGTISQRFDATESESKAHSHGTAMAGAIVSRERLLGVAPGAKILAVRAFSETGRSAESTSFNILKGMEWAISQGARVINMSFAGPYDPSLERALKDAAAKGVVLIGASGNAGPKSPPLWPGADPNVIAVTATDSGDKVFRQANRGPYVSVASPGVEILAPAPQAGYQLSTGTSIATAHVSGVVALMLERDPTLTPLDVRLILEFDCERSWTEGPRHAVRLGPGQSGEGDRDGR